MLSGFKPMGSSVRQPETPPTPMDSLAGSRRLRPHLPALVLAACLTIVFLARSVIVIRHLDLGSDIASYLSTTHIFFGQDPSGFGQLRPPLIALPLKAFTLVFGDLNGVNLLGVLLSVVIAIPFYLMAKRVCRPWIAVAMTIVFILTPAYADMLTWGYITMTGILFGLLTLHCFLLLLDKPSKVNVILTGLFASFVVGFHQLSLAFFLPVFVLLVAALLAFNRQALLKNGKAAVAAGVIGLILSLPYVPVYVRMLRMQASAGSGSFVSVAPSFLPWILCLVLSLPLLILALRWAREQHRNTAIVAAVLLLCSLVLVFFRLPSPFGELNRRAQYFIYPAIWLLAGVLLSRLWSWQTVHVGNALRWLPRAATIAFTIVLLSITSVMSQTGLTDGLDSYSYLDDTRWDAVQSIRDDTPRDASIAAYPESLGWWIEAESNRNAVTVTDRNVEPHVVMRERSLAADRVLSRNQGLENGNIRLATTYPYAGAPGQPVLGVYVSGFYHDVMMFDDRTISLAMEDGASSILANASEKEFTISSDGASMTMTTTYQGEGTKVIQTATLDRGSRTAVVSYKIQTASVSTATLDLPVLFGFEPESVLVASDQRSIEVVQFLRPQSDRVRTQIDIETAGAALQSTSTQDGRVDLSFGIQSLQATITFSFVVTDPSLDDSADVIHYQVPQILRDTALDHLPSIDYLAIDLKPNPHLASNVPWGTEEWLNACPYYKLVYSEGDIRVYEVDTSALP